MNPLLLAAQALVFGLWTFLMFRALFRLRRRAVERTGKFIPGVGDTLEGWAAFVRLPEFRTERLRLLAVTLLMFALIALNALLHRG